jgi:hypothetical protein
MKLLQESRVNTSINCPGQSSFGYGTKITGRP